MKTADQGVRQPAIAKRILPTDMPNILMPGRAIVHLKYPNNPEEQIIPEGCIGIIHTGNVKEISIIRDDCKTARKALREASSYMEENGYSEDVTDYLENDSRHDDGPL